MISNSAAVTSPTPAQVTAAKADETQFPSLTTSRQIILLDIVERAVS